MVLLLDCVALQVVSEERRGKWWLNETRHEIVVMAVYVRCEIVLEIARSGPWMSKIIKPPSTRDPRAWPSLSLSASKSVLLSSQPRG